MPFAQLNGQKIHYRDSGGRGPVVVLSKGFLMDYTMFDSQVASLSDKFRVLTWDESGFGDTEYDGKPFTYWDSANDCLALMTHLGVDSAVLGGMSQGGFLSLRAALTAPERVRALVLIDTASDNDGPETLAAYRGMVDAWVTNGPSDDLANIIADIIIAKQRNGPTGEVHLTFLGKYTRFAHLPAGVQRVVAGFDLLLTPTLAAPLHSARGSNG